MSSIKFPKSIRINRRRLFKRSELEHLKKVMFAEANGQAAPEYTPPPVERFVNATEAARELGISQSTMTRRLRAEQCDVESK